jgi:DNA-binding MarR family transcriptional regulator
MAAQTTTRELAERVHSLAIHLLRRVRAADAEAGLSAARLSALSVLVFGGPQTVGGLAEAEQVTAPTMSRLLTALEREGLVERGSDAADGRRVQVAATELGRAALEAGRARRVERLAVVLGDLGAGERTSVAEAVEILEKALERASSAA